MVFIKKKFAMSNFIFWIFFRESLRTKRGALICAPEYEVKNFMSFLLLGSCAVSFFESLPLYEPLHFLKLSVIATVNRGKWLQSDYCPLVTLLKKMLYL